MARTKEVRPLRHSVVVRVLKRVLRVFKKKPTLIYKTRSIEEPAIFIANHNAAAGPIAYTLYMPVFFIPWGAHPMTENFRSRWRYLYHVFYRQKLKFSKTGAWITATLFAPISGVLYRGVHLIPAYDDARLLLTLRQSMKHLKKKQAILIYPEDSRDGYRDIPSKFHPGFALLAAYHRRKTGNDIPIYPVHYNRQQNKMIIGEPHYSGPLADEGLNYDDIAEHYRAILNATAEHGTKHNDTQ